MIFYYLIIEILNGQNVSFIYIYLNQTKIFNKFFDLMIILFKNIILRVEIF